MPPVTTASLTEWFWGEFKRQYPSLSDGLCQCATEDLIGGSSDPGQMRAYYMFSVFIDQLMRHRFGQCYARFRPHFRFPELYAHGVDGMASPRWFIYPVQQLDQQMDWAAAERVGTLLSSEVQQWLEDSEGTPAAHKFRSLAHANAATFESQAPLVRRALGLG